MPIGAFNMSGLGSGELFMYMLQKNQDIYAGYEGFDGFWFIALIDMYVFLIGLFGLNQYLNMLIVFLTKYIILPISMQIAVPAGIVMPSLVCGAVFGRLAGSLLYAISPEYFPSASLFGACGAVCFLLFLFYLFVLGVFSGRYYSNTFTCHYRYGGF
jgi:H+/Cl- antiporter ClcA